MAGSSSHHSSSRLSHIGKYILVMEIPGYFLLMCGTKPDPQNVLDKRTRVLIGVRALHHPRISVCVKEGETSESQQWVPHRDYQAQYKKKTTHEIPLGTSPGTRPQYMANKGKSMTPSFAPEPEPRAQNRACNATLRCGFSPGASGASCGGNIFLNSASASLCSSSSLS